ncbi:prion-inhibition and propagation-domain-containing protein [Xylaria arbuscula]|uniref:Prion-inhibition and propagation HeLo domain-containing protein n=1 Tax=Xylaria arbuscula TaxID=114810 RepID=A0A9W8NHH3_9PEZI|nr:prion-inhibition and propagation-domain-containing protein [Xylaria arbuscula]KAJ3576577.1 hypothetical protein NPX13_g3652 [Xylaria arbuscula]
MEIAAAALQFTSTAIQAFHGCVIAIELFRTAQRMGADAEFFNTGLEFEKYRLIAWASRVGILNDNENQIINWHLASMILGQLESLLTSANVLRDKYSLDVSEADILAMNESSTTESTRSSVSKLIARLKPDLHTNTSKIISESNSAGRKLRWAARDRDKLKGLLKQISWLVNKLEFLLDSTERQQERKNYNRLLREVISLTTTTTEAGQIRDLFDDEPSTRKPINAAAYLKQVRLTLGADKREDEIIPKQPGNVAEVRLPKLAVLGRSLKPWGDYDLFSSSLEFATYRNQQVLIQWKTTERIQWERYTVQMKCLAVFLLSLSDKSFHSLPCLGYYPLEAQSRHGIMYSLPESGDWDFRSLKTLISTHPFVSLKRRLEIMREIADTVLQLHTAGWLHKSLRSENIIFLAPRGSDETVFLNSEPYVIGYEYSRSDTSDSAALFTELPDTDLAADLYRHPQARGANRETFQKRFDMYAMACIFTELIMWKPLVEIFSSYVTPGLASTMNAAQASNEAIKLPSLEELLQNESAVRCLVYQSGETLFEVVRKSASAERAMEGEEALLEDQTAIVNQLEWCRI